jgi:hypothetical protein
MSAAIGSSASRSRLLHCSANSQDHDVVTIYHNLRVRFTVFGGSFTPQSRSMLMFRCSIPSPSTVEDTMKNDEPRVRIELTNEQKNQIKEAAGHEIGAVEFSMEELEQRIAPSKFFEVKMETVIIAH